MQVLVSGLFKVSFVFSEVLPLHLQTMSAEEEFNLFWGEETVCKWKHSLLASPQGCRLDKKLLSKGYGKFLTIDGTDLVFALAVGTAFCGDKVAKFLLDCQKLQRFLDLSAIYFDLVFPKDWRDSVSENLVSLKNTKKRRTDYSYSCN
ncbi:hypothetical protein Tco_0407407 [Tanacetum coccineum]